MQHKFAEMAKLELEVALSRIPSDPTHKFVLFTETLRVLDYWAVFQQLLPKEHRLSKQDLDLIRWGWNRAVEYLFVAVETPDAFPILESTTESRLMAFNLLRQFGRSVLIQRTSEMIRFGFFNVESNERGFSLRSGGDAKDQFLDHLEFFHLEELENVMSENVPGFLNGWQLIDLKDYSKFREELGFFSMHDNERPLEGSILENVDELMVPLIHPWNSGHGMMVGYDADPRVDDHFLALALEQVLKWRVEAGIHPDTKFGELTGTYLTAIVTYVVALHMKHIRFCLLAMTKYPEISIPQSLTIWGPFNELAESVADFSGLDISLVKKALSEITMRPTEVSSLRNMTTLFIPLLISLDNGFVLRPVSSLIQNPFSSTITLQKWRNSSIRNRISEPREHWMRTELYAVFQGTRYLRVDGNINIRNGNKVVTDIDAAIFDTMSGELALFQIKWQDYFTNDVRELRSKASNLTKEMDDWANKVNAWINENGRERLARALRLNLPTGMSISSIYMFGISRTFARMRGYGFSTSNENLALANWPQFRRIRHETGPVERVFHSLFETLRVQMNENAAVQPLPVTIQVADTFIHFADLWFTYGDEDEED